MPDSKTTLLAITELGGYPDFTSLYQRLGFMVFPINEEELQCTLPRALVE